MRLIEKKRIISKYVLFSMVIMFIVMFVSWGVVSGFFEVLFMDYSAPDLSSELTKEEIRFIFLDQILVWERLISSSISYIVYFFPLFAVIPVVGLYKERTTIMNMACHREISQKKTYYKMILQYVLIGGLTVSITLLIYFTLFDYFMYPSISDIGGYMDIFPDDFYFNHPYLFFVFMAFSIYFFISISFALIGTGVAMITDREYMVLIVPLLVYFSENILFSITRIKELNIFESVLSYNTLYSTGQVFIPVLPIFFGGILLNIYGVHRQMSDKSIK